MRNIICILGVTLGIYLSSQAQQADVVDEKQTTASNIAATINNLGLVGNSFRGSFNVQNFSSCEFPAGSGVEHLFEGGLWIGGLVDGQVAVSTGAVDDPSGYATGKQGFEFTSKTPITERSALFDSPFFSPQAISHQDYTSVFTDTSITINTGRGNIPIVNHLRPLGVAVEFQALNWNFSFANFFVILNFKITNVKNTPIDSLFIGYWLDGVVRNVNITPPGGGEFFNKGGNGFIDSLNMGYEFDATGDIGFTDSYLGLKYLGSSQNGFCPDLPNFRIHYNTWQFRSTTDPLFFFPEADNQRYAKMRAGLNFLPNWPSIETTINTPNNRSTLISAGPYRRLNPGESVDIAFALVCARRNLDGNPAASNTLAQRQNLITNAGWAQSAYDGDDPSSNCAPSFTLPEPPPTPHTRVVSEDQRIEVYWADNAETFIDPISFEQDFEGYKIYKTQLGFDVQNTQDILNDLELIGSWDSDANGISFDTGLEEIRLEEPVSFEGDTNVYRYKYTFENVLNGWQHAIALTAFDTGDPVNNLPSLESAPLANLKRVFPGKPANRGFANGDPFAYPNPYYANASWEGVSSFEEDRKLIFANLPRRAQIRIYTVAGDLVDVIQHDEAYTGEDTRWFDTYSNPEETVFSGGEHAWDLLSRDNQIIARGLYLFVVTDEDTGDRFRGKFVIIR